jgi:hypothetical protein
MIDHVVVAAERWMEAEEAAADDACHEAAQQNGITWQMADDCDDGSWRCPNCPWRDW